MKRGSTGKGASGTGSFPRELTDTGVRDGPVPSVPAPSSPAPSPAAPAVPSPPPTRRLGLVVVGGLAFLGPLVGFLAGSWAASDHRFEAHATFREEVDRFARGVSLQMVSWEEVLYSLRGLYYSSEDVTRSEFGVFAHEARSRHPALLALEWAPRVPPAARAAHERQGREEGLSEYRIHGWPPPEPPDPPPEPEPAVPPPEPALAAPGGEDSFPVFYVEPDLGNRATLGFDLAGDPLRRTALARAGAGFHVALSDPVPLVQDPDGGPGVLLVLAVYDRPGASGRPGEELRGFVLTLLRLVDLLREVRRMVPSPEIAGLELRARDARGRAVVVRDPGASAEAADGDLDAEVRLSLAGREWWIRGRPTRAFLAGRDGVSPVLLGAAAFVVFEMLLGLCVLLVRMGRTRALQLRTRLVHSVLRSVGEGVVVADRRGRIRLANEAAIRLIGVGARDTLACEWARRYGLYQTDGASLYPEERLPLARAIRGESVQEEPVLIRNPSVPDGRWVDVTASPLLDEWNALQGGVLVMRDVTARRKAEEALQRLSRAVEQTADAVFITDRRGEIQYVNPAFEAATGYTAAEALGGGPRLFAPLGADHGFPESLVSAVHRGEPFRGSVVHRRKNGDLLHLEQTLTPVRDATGRVTHFVAVCRDLTERRRIEEQEVEMRLAAQVQQKLYPRAAPDTPGLDVAGAVWSAQATCGDYYDWFALPDRGYALAAGDVCGHGLGPALVMSETRAYLRSFLAVGIDPGAALGRVNALLSADLLDTLFVTLVFVRFDPRTRGLAYASAGHPPAYILGANGEVKGRLGATGLPIGLFPESTYQCLPGPSLEPGDVLLLMTDGASESRSRAGAFLGEEALVQVVRDARAGTAAEILARLHAAVRAHQGDHPPADDVTFVVAKATGR